MVLNDKGRTTAHFVHVYVLLGEATRAKPLGTITQPTMCYNKKMNNDKEVKCVEQDCPNTFVITEGEEKFYTDKGMYLPKRCQDCRDKRRTEREERERQE